MAFQASLALQVFVRTSEKSALHKIIQSDIFEPAIMTDPRCSRSKLSYSKSTKLRRDHMFTLYMYAREWEMQGPGMRWLTHTVIHVLMLLVLKSMLLCRRRQVLHLILALVLCLILWLHLHA